MTTAATTIFGRITQVLTAKKQAAEQTYAELVIAIASGKDVDPERVAAVLKDDAKTVEQMQADVEHVSRRREMKERNASLKKSADAYESLRKKIEALDAEFKAFEEKHAEKVWPVQQALRVSTDSISTIDTNRDELIRSCKNPALHAEKLELQDQIDTAAQQLRQRSNTLERLRGQLGDLSQAKSPGTHPKDIARATEEANQLRTRVDGARVEREAAEREFQRLSSEMEGLVERMRQSDF